jgi:hypothetical protein
MLFIILTIVVLLVLTYVIFCREFGIVQNYSSAKHHYNKLAKDLFGALNSLEMEWWPCEGTLIGMLRYGDNFDVLPDFGPIGTDNDIDVMVRADTDKDWRDLQKRLKKVLKRRNYFYTSGIRIIKIYNKKIILGNRLKNTVPFFCDVHRYAVKDGLAYSPGHPTWPFKAWGGKIPRVPFIVDENGRMKKCLFDGMTLPCANRFLEILCRWNGGKYDPEKVKYPLGGMYNVKGKFRMDNDLTPHALTARDKKHLHDRWAELQRKGYASF